MNLQILKTSQLVPGSHGLEDMKRQEVHDTQPILTTPKAIDAHKCAPTLSQPDMAMTISDTTFQKLHLSFVKALSFALTYRANQIQIQLDSFRFCRNLLLNMGLSKPLQYNGKILYDVKSSIIRRCCKVHGKNRVPLLDAYSNPSP